MAVNDSDSCSALTLAAGEPLAGTATQASVWIAIEQSGPFGRDALTESRFPADIGAELVARADEIGAKVVLIRCVGKHAESITEHDTRKVWVARPASGAGSDGQDTGGTASMVRTEVSDPAELLAINFAKLLDSNLTDAVPHSTPDNEPLLLVCTHAKRDVCCALRGRPVALDLSERLGDANCVWEVSHLGGHRMAPTAVQLPHGYLHGRLDSTSAEHAWREATDDRLAVDTCRGRSSLTPAGQVAELAVRAEIGLFGLADVQVVQDRSSNQKRREDGLEVETWIVAMPASQDSWEVQVAAEELPDRPESCGKPAVAAQALRAIAIRRQD